MLAKPREWEEGTGGPRQRDLWVQGGEAGGGSGGGKDGSGMRQPKETHMAEARSIARGRERGRREERKQAWERERGRKKRVVDDEGGRSHGFGSEGS
jgi:hypothetical protein